MRPFIRHALCSLAANVACLHSPGARADDAALDQTPNELATVVVEARAIAGPAVSPSGANQYTASAEEIAAAPLGSTAPLSEVLTQMPGVAIDQNQQIHIRNTEGPQFQYQINGVLIPLDINTNPPFLSMINPLFIQRLDLLDGVLPARYSYATGGVVSIQTKDGCGQPLDEVSLLVGQRETIEPAMQLTACHGDFASYLSGLYQQGNSAFSSATPAPTPIHDFTHQGQLFSYSSYHLTGSDTLSLILSGAESRNELPNVPGLAPAYQLEGYPVAPPSQQINSYLDFTDVLAVLALNGTLDHGLSYQIAYSQHFISERFEPDPVGELIYQGVASRATHEDHDYTLEGDLSLGAGGHQLGAGFYAAEYRVSASDSSLVFPADDAGNQLSAIPTSVVNDAHANNYIGGVYISDVWELSRALSASAGVRWDSLSGFSSGHQLDPSVSLVYRPTSSTTLHAGFARYFQVPSLLGISPTAQAAFQGTTAQGPPGISTPIPEDDREWDVGVVQALGQHLTLSADAFYEWTTHYLDTGQFGEVPIFAPFNYGTGHIWGSELALRYQAQHLTGYANLTAGRNWQRGVSTGQFNFDPDELAYIDSHAIVLDHQPLYGASAGLGWRSGDYSLSADGIYSSGLRAGFADLERLPIIKQVNLGAERSFPIPGWGTLTDRITVLNVLDRVNLIRPAEGIGIFQSAYAPRRTLFASIALRF